MPRTFRAHDKKSSRTLLFAVLTAGMGTALGPFAAKPEDPSPNGKKATEAKDPALGGLEADPKATGAIAGRILLKGKPPETKPHAVPPDHKDRPICGGEVPDERFILGPGSTLSNAVVSLEKVPGAPKPAPRTITLDNVKCRFVPHVQATTTGSTIKITTQDSGVLHSAMALARPGFNVSVSSPDHPVERKLTHPGWIPIKCAVHGWMQAHVQVFPHDFFAVSGKDGEFRLRGIPPGKYQVKVWHEALEEAQREVTVEPGKTAELNLELKPFAD